MTSVRFMGRHVTKDDVLAAVRRYDTEYPRNDYDNGRDKGNYKYAIFHGGRPCPPKLMMAWVIGLPDTSNCGFSGGSQTNNSLEDLGFDVGAKPLGG